MKQIGVIILVLSVFANLTYGQLIIFGGGLDTTYRFSMDTIKTSGDSTFITLKQIKNGRLIHQEDQIFVSTTNDENRVLSQTIFHGNSQQWYYNRQKKCEGQFHYGQKIGVWKYWDKNGNEIKEKDLPKRNVDYIYIDGKKVKIRTTGNKK